MVKNGIRLVVRDLEEYFFCPLVFYFSVALGHGRADRFWAEVGKKVEKDVEKKISERFEVLKKDFEVESERLRVRGKVDYVVRADPFAALEVKYSHSIRPWWKYSAVLYGILLEETVGKPVKTSFIYLTESERVEKIRIGDEDRRFVERSIRDCFEILSGKIPKASASRSCENCDYRNMCEFA